MVAPHSTPTMLQNNKDFFLEWILQNKAGHLMLFTQCIGESYVTFLGPENFVLFEKHQKAFSGALQGAFRAREVLGSFEKRTPASGCLETA